MIPRIHLNSSMFLPNPYVVRVSHPDCTLDNMKLAEFMQFRKTAKQQIKSTWGYSDPAFEIIKSNNEQATFFNGVITYTNPEMVCHSYWVFTEDMDALQFRLTAGESIKMHMWPTKIKFTIYEYNAD